MVSYGTNDAIDRLVETYGGMLLRLACTRLGNTMDAEDAVQEVFLYLVEHQVAFKNETHEKAWLIRATLHRASNIRARAGRCDLPLDPEADVGRNGDFPGAGEENALAEEIHRLPEEYASPLYLHYYEGYSTLEIARMLNISPAAVRTRLYRGRNLLRKALKEDES